MPGFEWINFADYIVIVVMMLIAIGLIAMFVDHPSKKILMILGVVATGGLALFFTHKKKQYNEELIEKEKERYNDFVETTKAKQKQLEDNFSDISAYYDELEEINGSTDDEISRIKSVTQKIKTKLAENEGLSNELKAGTLVIAENKERRKQRQPLESIESIYARHGIAYNSVEEPAAGSAVSELGSSQQEESQATTPMPKIVVDGFEMKGDLA